MLGEQRYVYLNELKWEYSNKKISETKKRKIIDITLNRTMFEYRRIFFYRILFEPPTTTYVENQEYLRK